MLTVCTGLANVLIFYNTIRIMKPVFHDNANVKASRRKTESFLSDPKNTTPVPSHASEYWIPRKKYQFKIMWDFYRLRLERQTLISEPLPFPDVEKASTHRHSAGKKAGPMGLCTEPLTVNFEVLPSSFLTSLSSSSILVVGSFIPSLNDFQDQYWWKYSGCEGD